MQHGQHFRGASIFSPSLYTLVHHYVHPSDHPAKVRLVSKHHPGLGLCTKNTRDIIFFRTRCILCAHAQCLVLETGQTHQLIAPWIHKTAKEILYLCDLCGKESRIKRPKVAYFFLTNDMHALILWPATLSLKKYQNIKYIYSEQNFCLLPSSQNNNDPCSQTQDKKVLRNAEVILLST